MTMQPSPPPVPQAPVLSAQDRADLAQGIRDANAIGQQAQREVAQVVAQTNREMARTGSGGNASVIKDGAGRIVVTGPNQKTVVIDPRVGLDGDQIQAMVQTALQPSAPPRSNEISSVWIPIVAIVFTFLFLIALVISRAISGRRVTAGVHAVALPPEATARLARIEQAVEAVAIEVERISEAQRYSAQLLTDRLSGPAPTIPAVSASRANNG